MLWQVPKNAEGVAVAGNQSRKSLLAYLLPLVIALSWCLARPASARCEIALDGDPEVVDDIQAALFTFGRDDLPCVTVRALCSRDDSQVVVDLQDQFGRSVQRRFTSAIGAAAFLISWSRRPLPQEGTDLAPPPPTALPPPIAPPRSTVMQPVRPRAQIAVPDMSPPGMTPEMATRAASPPAPGGLMAVDGWHPEVRAAYLPGLEGPAGLMDGAVVRYRGRWHYGPHVRAVAASAPYQRFVYESSVGRSVTVPLWLSMEAEMSAGVQWTLGRLVIRGDLAAGAAYLTVMSESNTLHFQGVGGRGGARLAIATQLVSALWLEAGAGVETVLLDRTDRADYVFESGGPLLSHGLVDVGLVWTL